ncbi:MAG: ABC-2 family transporter protein [Candidatus Woesearchaeota archaeon]
MYITTLFKKSWNAQTQYVLELILSNIQIFLQGITSFVVGLYANATLDIYTQQQLLYYYIFGVGFLLFFTRNNMARDFGDMVVAGNIVPHLLRPYTYIIFYLWHNLSTLIYRALTTLALYIIVSILFFDLSIHLMILLRALIIIPIALFYIYCVHAFFCLLSFVFERIDQLAHIIFMVAFFAGGGLVPVSMYPSVFLYLPTSFLYYHPLHMIISGDMQFALLAATYVGGMFIATFTLYHVTKRYIQVHGG